MLQLDPSLGFALTKSTPLHELGCILHELVHVPTGAHIMHLANDDPENLFCLSFQTLPQNSNGVAHILEHTVLCGSKKFPVKDPFFAMSRRSLNTFMNALTGADFTCYPASSQVEQDFYNLLEVYLDAVFHPELKQMSFLQEGWRLSNTNPTDATTPLQYKGIVYNEMKGSLTSRDSRTIQKMMEGLFPDLPYAFNSGGTPQEIPNLTYAELVDFHKTYYHPSHCLFFFYGNLKLEQHLAFIEEHSLRGVSKAPPLPPIKQQPRLTTPLVLNDRFPANAAEDEKTSIAFGWLTVPQKEQKELLALSVLDSILMDTDGSLLKLPLLKSKLCVQASAFMDGEMSEVPYIILCKGCKKEDADELQNHLFLTFREIALNGIPHHLIEAAIHQLEFARLEIVGDHAPYGLTLFMRSGLAKQHQCPPENALLIHSLFEELLIQVKDPEYLPSLIRKHYLNNPHFVRLVMEPDTGLLEEEATQEKEQLAKIQEALSASQKDEIIRQNAALKTYQEETEKQSLDCLPQIQISDIPLLTRDFPLHKEKIHHLEVFHHACFTNQIIYADLIFNLPELTEEELPYLQLLATLLPELGAGDRDYIANLEFIHSHTGGLNTSIALYAQASNPTVMRPCFTLRGKALHRKAKHLFTLFKDSITFLHLNDHKRVEELIIQLHLALQNRVTRNALKYAIQLALSGFSSASQITEKWSGIKYYHAIKQLVSRLDTDIEGIIAALISLKERLFTTQDPHLVLCCDQESYGDLKKEQFYGLGELPMHQTALWKPNLSLTPTPSQGRIISSPVAFTCQAYPTVNYLHPHAPGLALSTFIMDHTVLHAKVREQGGAYGVGAHYAAMLGQFYLHSYRDPHIAQTLHTFDEAILSLAKEPIAQSEITQAKLTMTQGLDSPISPGSRAIASYSWEREGKTREMRQNYRDRILALTPHDVQKAVAESLLTQKEKRVLVTLASASLLEEENAKLSSPIPITDI